MPWSDGLTPGTSAYEIASSTNERLRVVAGPGTGKSFAMKRRVARLLEAGIPPADILPVTFTRVAAEDLHRELVGMGVPGCDELQGTTLHSLALRVLIRNHVLNATGRHPRPLNEFELEPMVCDLMAEHGGKKEVRRLQFAYEAAWARLQHEEPGYALTAEDEAFQHNLRDWLRFHQAMLIGEVIPQLYDYLRTNPAAEERSQYSHILVDEYQDLNKAEQGVIQLLSDAAEVCIVGDDDQSIYSFKHANPDGIRDWLVQNRGADDLTLDDCRRCPTRVVEIAAHLVRHNVNRPVPRALLAMPANGRGDVRIIQYSDAQREVRGVARLVMEFLEQGTPPGDILVLAQSRAVGTPIYEALVGNAVPTKSYYAEPELASVVAQGNFALLKLLVNRQDRVALRWLLGVNASNWNAAGYARVREHCEATGATPWDVLVALANGTLRLPHTGRIIAKFRDLAGQIEVLETHGTVRELIDDLFSEGLEEVRDVRALALDTIEENEEIDASSLLRQLTTAISQPEIPSEVTDVRVMSLHKSKGLSAPVTIIAGCVEGILPRRPDPDLSPNERARYLEEQRRLFYVGITRVKAAPRDGKPGTLVLTYSQEMPLAEALSAGITPAQRYYGTAVLIGSRFIRELGPAAPAPTRG